MSTLIMSFVLLMTNQSNQNSRPDHLNYDCNAQNSSSISAGITYPTFITWNKLNTHDLNSWVINECDSSTAQVIFSEISNGVYNCNHVTCLWSQTFVRRLCLNYSAHVTSFKINWMHSAVFEKLIVVPQVRKFFNVSEPKRSLPRHLSPQPPSVLRHLSSVQTFSRICIYGYMYIYLNAGPSDLAV
jgi:hypothetical protein